MARKKQWTTAKNPPLEQELQCLEVGSDLEGDLSLPPAGNFAHALSTCQTSSGE